MNQPTWPYGGSAKRRPAPRPSSAPAGTPPKYGPTPLYDDCEGPDCDSRARTSCATCQGHYCRTHAEHPHH